RYAASAKGRPRYAGRPTTSYPDEPSMDLSALVTELDRTLPGFAGYVASPDNLFERQLLRRLRRMLALCH
ncbi:MAG TPA: hypothetical protein VKB50_08880, partial [Vicinamibacterales bacterium]|nr:hypothetical protein [Vicinamibacterales bacterium]